MITKTEFENIVMERLDEIREAYMDYHAEDPFLPGCTLILNGEEEVLKVENNYWEKWRFENVEGRI